MSNTLFLPEATSDYLVVFTEVSTAALAGAIIGLIIAYALFIVPMWRIFRKAGEAGWKSLIPFYSSYITYKIAWKPKFFLIGLILSGISVVLSAYCTANPSTLTLWLYFLALLLSFVSLVIGIRMIGKLSKAFGHGAGYTLGMIFLGVVFYYIIAFGKSEYKGPQ